MNLFGRRESDPAPAQTTDEQSLERYRYMLATAPPEDIERAHEEAFARLTPEVWLAAIYEYLGDVSEPVSSPVIRACLPVGTSGPRAPHSDPRTRSVLGSPHPGLNRAPAVVSTSRCRLSGTNRSLPHPCRQRPWESRLAQSLPQGRGEPAAERIGVEAPRRREGRIPGGRRQEGVGAA